MEKYIVALITAPTKGIGAQIARALVEQRLAACVSIVEPVTSIYTWAGQVHEDAEVLLIAKTQAAHFAEKFVPAVQALHPYDVPEIIALPITAGAPSYLDWIGETVKA
ncbi:MAG: divalent-cation tolerance protein CutA [Anaerolineae bacterium]|nr:divalent-cation tolerance protein CutA [Anaerolineae bacterium]